MLQIIGLILLWILRIIGIILGLILLLLLLILFVPFRYSAEGEFEDGQSVHVRFSWLLYFINGSFKWENSKTATIVRIWFFKVYKDPDDKKKGEAEALNKELAHKDEKEDKVVEEDRQTLEKIETSNASVESNPSYRQKEDEGKKKDQEEKLSIEHKDNEEAIENLQEKESKSEIELEQEQDKEALDESSMPKNSDEEAQSKKESKEKRSKTKDKKTKDKESESGLDKAKDMWAFLQAPENEGLLKFITKYLIKILKWILPRKAEIDMEIGLEDPSITGYIAGLTSVIYTVSNKNVYIRPNFNEKVVKGHFKVKGRLFLFQLVYYIVRVIIDKRVRRLIKKVRA